MDLFDYMREQQKESESPLASRMRPTTLDEVVGQQHIIGKDKLLYRAIKADKLSSIIFYGPPGTGKTTLAKVIANTTSAEFMQINATSSGKKDMEDVVAKAKDNQGMFGKKTILFIDEITTCNPYIQGPLLDLIFSRSIGEEKLPDNVMVIAAGNYASDLNGEFTMSSPLVNRFVLLNLSEDDFDVRESLSGTFRDLKTPEDIETFLELKNDKYLAYDYDAFIEWLYSSNNVGFGKYVPEEVNGLGLLGFTSTRSLDFSVRFARKYMEMYSDNSWMRVVGDTLGTSAKKEGKPLRDIIEMEEDKFCKVTETAEASLGELLNEMAKADTITLESLNTLKRTIIATPSSDITNYNLRTLIEIVKSGKPGVTHTVMNDCVTLITNKFNEV